MSPDRRRFDRIALLAAALLFSSGGTVIKLSALPALQLAAGRSLLAAAVLFVAFPAWRRFWDRRAVIVGLGYAGTMVLFVVANKLTMAANAIFLQSTAPVYVLFLAPWLLGERNRWTDVALTGCILGGLLLFFVGGEDPSVTAPHPQLGNLVAAASGLCWATTLVGLRWIVRAAAPGESPGALAGGAVIAGNLLACAACLPFAAGFTAPTLPDLVVVTYLGLFQIGLAYVCLTRGIAGVPALEASLLLLLEPVMSASIAAAVHGERPGPAALAGCAVILAATAARSLPASRRPDAVS